MVVGGRQAGSYLSSGGIPERRLMTVRNRARTGMERGTSYERQARSQVGKKLKVEWPVTRYRTLWRANLKRR